MEKTDPALYSFAHVRMSQHVAINSGADPAPEEGGRTVRFATMMVHAAKHSWYARTLRVRSSSCALLPLPP